MGDIVGAGLVSHAPVIMFPQEMRLEANGGKDFTLATGLTRLGAELDTLSHDTVVVVDTHWATTTETVLTSHARRTGVFTSDEMPGAIHSLPYDLPGDPELAKAFDTLAAKRSVWASANDNEHLPVHYGLLNIHRYLGRPGVPWLSLSVCQTAEPEDYLAVGALLAEAARETGRRVVVLASGGLSHRFWPLRELRARMAGDPAHIISAAAREADLARIAWLERGEHRKVIETMPEYAAFEPEARFGHYLTLAGAIGGTAATTPARRFSEYENGIGTGHVHLWFDRPARGWPA
ncbi:aromatic ring-opening dioxygenase catalytic subunit (LigB family) [Crossiella equi]|uniref:Aromatic ring-opening dioxygenase catalytic subunit (LigB family) n=1 Tax=Crossiella equi TaxID=130796 RepID=A0ABS5A7I9_9PSEU|nr:catechol 1,2-dioxygenase [Crossiella equi]MBP2472559.1 aromatic ring-opening dioxygenase catalytic subunit (LigB family) [Crossiella equi]